MSNPMYQTFTDAKNIACSALDTVFIIIILSVLQSSKNGIIITQSIVGSDEGFKIILFF